MKELIPKKVVNFCYGLILKRVHKKRAHEFQLFCPKMNDFSEPNIKLICRLIKDEFCMTGINLFPVINSKRECLIWRHREYIHSIYMNKQIVTIYISEKNLATAVNVEKVNKHKNFWIWECTQINFLKLKS